MDMKNVRNRFYSQMDKSWTDIEGFLGIFARSKFVNDYIFRHYESLLYANVISNFFGNLTSENVREENLPMGKLGTIRTRYKDVRLDVNRVFQWKIGHKVIEERYYENFKHRLKKDFPEFIVVLDKVEKASDLTRAGKYLYRKHKALDKLGKTDASIEDQLVTLALERFLRKGKGTLELGEFEKTFRKVVNKDVLLRFSDEIYQKLKRSSPEALGHDAAIQTGFKARLYSRWQVPLDLLDSMIKLASESGERKKTELVKRMNKANKFQYSALIRINARALLIAREILALLKAGYPDGAFARWRSLHELAVTSIFLHQNADYVSERYLNHSKFKHYKDAVDYQMYAKKLGYAPMKKRDLNTLARECAKLIRKHGSDFAKGDYDWIPKSILADRNFRALEKYIQLDKYRPYYNMSSTGVHGGSRALFYSLAVMDHKRNKLILVGPSNYGLADPIQNTAMSLMHATMSLLALNPDLQDSIALGVLSKYVLEIGPEAVNVQRQIEKEEREMKVEKRRKKLKMKSRIKKK